MPSTVESLVSVTTLDHARGLAQLAVVFVGLVLFVGTAAALSPGETFCNSAMAQTIQNVFTIIQFGGPMLGGVFALGATVGLPFVRQSDWKKELREIHNQGLVWGVVVAPLGTQILSFILNNVVVGGTPVPSERHPPLASLALAILATLVVAVPATAHPPTEPVPGVNETTFPILWSGDVDGNVSQGGEGDSATEAVRQLANGSDVPLTAPPADVETWISGEIEQLPSTNRSVSIRPTGARAMDAS